MSRSFKKYPKRTRKQLREKAALVSSMRYDEENLCRIYSVYYHLSILDFEIGKILEPIEPQWVSSYSSERVVEEYKKGIFTTSIEGLLEWFPMLQRHYDNKLFMYGLKPTEKWSAASCSIRTQFVFLEQYFIFCPVEIVSKKEASTEVISNLYWNELLGERS